jgi:hypothetical protein
MSNTLEMIINGDTQDLLSFILADHIFIELGFDSVRLKQVQRMLDLLLLVARAFFLDKVISLGYAIVAYMSVNSRDKNFSFLFIAVTQ